MDLIEKAVKSLSQRHPLFQSEEDLKTALADELQHFGFSCEIDKMHDGNKTDVWAEHSEEGSVYGILLHNKTAKLEATSQGRDYDLNSDDGHALGRYDFVKDIADLEKLAGEGGELKGAVIMVTNDQLYWQPPAKLDSVDKDFLLFNGRKMFGKLKWGKNASENKVPKTEIKLRGSYQLNWKYYYKVKNDKNGEFKYLYVRV
ncbi:hypothetical protein [Evansella clarkii]|uniref:hypothetical protein n=1 Tax=Evansella clarkii TaxID=79879 RepID=UPI000997CBB8|nr:hypothetical protein [Evansella clarkii]